MLRLDVVEDPRVIGGGVRDRRFEPRVDGEARSGVDR